MKKCKAILIIGMFVCLFAHVIPVPISQAYTDHQAASVLVGHDSFSDRRVDYFNTQNGINNPTSLTTDGTKLIVADNQNNRVLIYNSLPTSNYAPADVVIGQSDFIGINCNRGNAAPTEKTLCGPQAVLVIGTKLYVSDSFNNRVLIYNSIPTTNDAAADVVLGQPDFVHRGADGGSDYGGGGGDGVINDKNMFWPGGLTSDGTHLAINDYGNSRVIIYNSLPTTNYQAIDVVVGAVDKNSFGSGSTNDKNLNFPNDCAIVSGHLLISDGYNNRVLIFDTIPTTDYTAADHVIGQDDFSHNTGNQGSDTPTASTLLYPNRMYSDGTKLFISDVGNSRILVYNSLPNSDGAAADDVLGQPDFTTGTVDYVHTSSTTLLSPLSVLKMGSKYLIADTGDNRILIYDSVPTNGAAASVVIGQRSFSRRNYNVAYHPELRVPLGQSTDGEKLAVADSGNNRVVIYNSIPTENGAIPDVVLGQPDLYYIDNNQGVDVNQATMSAPSDVLLYDHKLIVTDSGNNRVLIYNSIPTTNGALPDVVIGQEDFNHSDSNQGTGPSEHTLYRPLNLAVSDGKLLISDANNNRVLIYNSIPTENNAAADVVIGQQDFAQTSANQGDVVSSSGLDFPAQILVADHKLLIVDSNNYRVLIYNSIPTEDNAAADLVIGQTALDQNEENQGGAVGANTLSYPWGIAYDGTHLFVGDEGNNRILIYNGIPTENNASAVNVIGQPDMSTADWPDPSDKDFGDIASLAVDGAGHLFAADDGYDRIMIFTDPDFVAATPTPTPFPSPNSEAENSSRNTQEETKPEVIQIQQTSGGNQGVTVSPTKDSNPGDKKISVIVPSETFDFNAYLQVNKTKPIEILPPKTIKSNAVVVGDGSVMAIKSNGSLYWQVGELETMWFKTYAPAGKDSATIIPSQQKKSSIVILSFKDSELFHAGSTTKKFDSKKLQIAYSADGITWKILPYSVVNTTNHTIAVAHKLGGYYVVVGK